MNLPIPGVDMTASIVGLCRRRSFVPAVVVSGLALPVVGILPFALPEVAMTMKVGGEEPTTNITVI
jgi:hypothetical protein